MNICKNKKYNKSLLVSYRCKKCRSPKSIKYASFYYIPNNMTIYLWSYIIFKYFTLGVNASKIRNFLYKNNNIKYNRKSIMKILSSFRKSISEPI